jgi:signal peptidase
MMPTTECMSDDRDMLVHTLRRVVAWILGLVLVAGTATALGVALFPVVTGGAALAVLSGSMTPGLPVGGMAFVRPVDAATVEPGDVITFQRRPDAPELVTHRVLAVDDTGASPVFTTKGDANEDADLDPVPASAVRGKMWFGLPHVGRLAAVLHSPKGAGLLVVLVCAVIAATPGPRPGRTAPERDGKARGGAEPAIAATDTPAAADLVDAADARTVVMPVVEATPPPHADPPSPNRVTGGLRPPSPPRPAPRLARRPGQPRHQHPSVLGFPPPPPRFATRAPGVTAEAAGTA